MAAVTVSRSADRLVAVKQVPAERADEIEREADLLRRFDHPGLVRFVDIVETSDGGRALHTEFVNADTWATRPVTEPAERAAQMAALAATVADLHQSGVAHLQITAPHVLHGAGDRPVLCGLTRAGQATPENCGADVAALGELCHDSSLGRGAIADKLAAAADSARAGMLNARELARQLDLITTKKPTGSDPAGGAAGDQAAKPKTRLRPKSLVAAGAFTAAVVAAFSLGARSGSSGPADGAPPAASPEDPTGAAESGADPSIGSTQAAPATAIDQPASTDSSHTRERSELSEATAVDTTSRASAPDQLDDRGRPVEASPKGDADLAVSMQEAAAVIEHGGRRYAVGAAGDFVETGDWDCDGQVTAAIVRPSTGGVVLFDAWPEPDGTIALTARWSVDSPTGAEAVAHGQCDLLRVYTTSGSQLFNPAES